jgi:hypothetical protein
MVSTVDFNWTLPHGRIQFLPHGNIRPCPENHRISDSPGFRSFFPKSNLYHLSLSFRHPLQFLIFTIFNYLQSIESVTAYCIFEQFPNNTRRKDLLLFYIHQQLHSDMLVQPTRIPGTASMLAPIPRSPGRPDNRTHTAVYPPVGNFWCAIVHCSSEHRSCRSGTYKAAQITTGSRDTASRLRLICLRRSASHSAIAIFP